MAVVVSEDARPEVAPRWLGWSGAAVPALLWLAVVTLALRARLTTGSWPSYGQPDPSEFGVHYQLEIALYLLTLAVAISTPIVIFGGAMLRLWRIDVRTVAALGVLVAGLVGYLWFMNADVAGLSTWLAD